MMKNIFEILFSIVKKKKHTTGGARKGICTLLVYASIMFLFFIHSKFLKLQCIFVNGIPCYSVIVLLYFIQVFTRNG